MNVENVSRDDWILGGVGLLLVIDLLFLPWFSISIGPLTATSAATGAPDGWLGVLAVLAALAVIADLAIERLSPQTHLPAIADSRTQYSLRPGLRRRRVCGAQVPVSHPLQPVRARFLGGGRPNGGVRLPRDARSPRHGDGSAWHPLIPPTRSTAYAFGPGGARVSARGKTSERRPGQMRMGDSDEPASREEQLCASAHNCSSPKAGSARPAPIRLGVRWSFLLRTPDPRLPDAPGEASPGLPSVDDDNHL